MARRRRCRCHRVAAPGKARCAGCIAAHPSWGQNPASLRNLNTRTADERDMPAHVIESIISRAHAARRPLWRTL